MAINQLNKYVWLVETIHRARNRGGITLKEIQSRWLDSDLSEGTELNRRTFINNLHAIEELFEITIECGSGFRYHIEYGDCFEEGSARNWLLNAFSLNAMVGNGRKLKEMVLLEDMPSGRNFLEEIIKAMRDNHVVFVSYYSFNTEEYHEFDIHPYFVKAFKTKYLNSYKIIVAGGRDFDNYEYLKEKLDETFSTLGDLDAHPIEIISGMADGADSLGIKYAKEQKLTMVLYPANWEKYPRMAGILRNMNMLVTATHLVAFWDGKSHGTKHMIEIAKEKGIPVWIYKYC